MPALSIGAIAGRSGVPQPMALRPLPALHNEANGAARTNKRRRAHFPAAPGLIGAFRATGSGHAPGSILDPWARPGTLACMGVRCSLPSLPARSTFLSVRRRCSSGGAASDLARPPAAVGPWSYATAISPSGHPSHHYGSMFSAHPLLERGSTPYPDGLQPHMEIGRRPSSSSGSVCPAGRRSTKP